MSLTRIKQEDVTEGLKAIGGNVVLSGRYYNQVKGAATNPILSRTCDRNVEAGGAKITRARTARIKGISYTRPQSWIDRRGLSLPRKWPNERW